MKERHSLSSHEIRILRLDKNGIFDVLGKIFDKIGYKKFLLPNHGDSAKRVYIEWKFDEKKYEIVMFAYPRGEVIDRDEVITYISRLSREPLESLCVNIQEKYYQSIKLPAFQMSNSKAKTIKTLLKERNVLRRIFSVWNRCVHPLRKHELRVIQLSKKAIHELLWEYFMDVGEDIMGIPEEDSEMCKTIFSMTVKGKLEELKLYALNLNESSLVDDDALDMYCEKNVGITTDFVHEDVKNRNYCTSLIIPDSCLKDMNVK